MDFAAAQDRFLAMHKMWNIYQDQYKIVMDLCDPKLHQLVRMLSYEHKPKEII
jgi:hypothetical protein